MTVPSPDPAVLKAAQRMAAERRELRHGMRLEWLRENTATAQGGETERQQMIERLASAAGVDLADLVARSQRDAEAARTRFSEWRQAAVAQRGVSRAAGPGASQLARSRLVGYA